MIFGKPICVFGGLAPVPTFVHASVEDITSLQSVNNFTAIIPHKEGNTDSFFYIISLFGDGDGGAAPRKPEPALSDNLSPPIRHLCAYKFNLIYLHSFMYTVKYFKKFYRLTRSCPMFFHPSVITFNALYAIFSGTLNAENDLQ